MPSQWQEQEQQRTTNLSGAAPGAAAVQGAVIKSIPELMLSPRECWWPQTIPASIGMAVVVIDLQSYQRGDDTNKRFPKNSKNRGGADGLGIQYEYF